MNINNCEINVLVKGRSITEFAHRGQVFIEGRGGSNYELEFRNRNGFSVEVILSVDGLSVTDGKIAGPDSRGYIVNAHGVLKVPGWTLDDAQVAAFAFAAERGGSYVEQSTGSAVNKGVIGALVFKEKPKAYSPPHSPITAQPYPFNPPTYPGVWQKSPGVPYRMTDQSWGASTTDSYSALGGGGMMRGMMQNAALNESVTASAAPFIGASLSMKASASASAEPLDAVEQTLGTAFGDATDFRTTKVSFERGDMVAMIVMYYDDLRGLKARGIQVERRKPQTQPQAFPGMSTGCVPPAGWAEKNR